MQTLLICCSYLSEVTGKNNVASHTVPKLKQNKRPLILRRSLENYHYSDRLLDI